jgi:hypothetical protein
METFLVKEKGAIIIHPLCLLDHSGLRMKIGSFNDAWDSGQVGYIYATADEIRKNFLVKRISKKTLARAEKCLEAEVETYDNYLSGSVYGLVLKESGEETDSCWGFYGWDYVEKQAEEWLDNATKKAEAAAWKSLNQKSECSE